MDELVQLVFDSECLVKIITVVETSYGHGGWHPEYLQDEKNVSNHVFVKKDWNQVRLTQLEMNRRYRPVMWVESSNLVEHPYQGLMWDTISPVPLCLTRCGSLN